MRDLVPRQGAGHPAVAQADDPIGALPDLVQPVRDVDDADPQGTQLADDRQETVGLREREARGRLVHDDEPRLERQGLGDLDHLALGDREVGDRRRRAEVDAEALEERSDHGVETCPVDQPQRPAPQRLAADEDVGGDVQIVEEVELLVDEGDAGGHRLGHREPRMLDTVDDDGTGVGRHHPAQHLHQGALAGAVLADQAHDLACVSLPG